MSFAKSIIEKYLANLAEGTQPDAAELDALIDAEQPKQVVPKQTYLDEVKKANDLKDTIKDLKEQVEDGSKAAETVKELQAKIDENEKAAAKAKAESDFAVTAEKHGVTNARIIRLALQDKGVDLETIDPELLAVKIDGLKTDEDFKGFFKSDDEDDEETEKGNDPKAGANGAAGFKPIDNGIKGKGKKAEADAIAERINRGFGLT